MKCKHAGFDALDTVIILSNQKTVDRLKKANPNYGVDINLIMGKDSALAQSEDNWTEDQTAVSSNMTASCAYIMTNISPAILGRSCVLR